MRKIYAILGDLKAFDVMKKICALAIIALFLISGSCSRRFYAEFNGKIPQSLLSEKKKIGFTLYRDARPEETILPAFNADGKYSFRKMLINDFPDCIKLEADGESLGEYCKRRRATGQLEYYNPVSRRAIALPVEIKKGKLYKVNSFDY